ncbi:DUF559 domain-containing protein [Microlunatus ginsengisoli]
MTAPLSGSFDPNRPFRRRDGLAAGITPDELTGPRFQRLFHGLYVSAEVPADTWQRARAALAVCPSGSYVSHETAAILRGGCVPGGREVHVSVPDGGYRPQRRGIVAHRAPAGVEPVRHRRLPMSTATRSFLEVASGCRDLVELVVLGDSLVRAGATTPDALVVAAARHRGPGARIARAAARCVRLGVDSPTESRLRMLIVLARLPEPVVNHVLRDAAGEWIYRLDLSYPALRLIIEYDGRQHRDVRAQWVQDLRRREALERDGWRIVVLTADDLYGDPIGTLGRIRQALTDRGVRSSSRLPLDWQRAFTAPATRAA